MVHRGIATLSGALMFCFLSLAGLDNTLFFLHFYESLMYLAIILMLFYLEDQWAYMLGMIAPPIWILQQIATGVLWGALRQTAGYLSGSAEASGIGVVTLLTAVLCVLMVIFCARHWKREFSGLGRFRNTFLGALGIVILYYAVYWFWFGSLFPWA